MINQEEVLRLLHYNPDTGVITWRITRGKVKAGDIAGTLHDGYVYIKVNRKRYLAHRIAWLYMTGSWPSMFIDHINIDKSDNRWCNLREADRFDNAYNIKPRKYNKSGYVGVSFQKKTNKWFACYRRDGKSVTIGRFTCKHDAAQAYNDIVKELRGDRAILNTIIRG